MIIIDSGGFPLNYEIFQVYENEKIDAQVYPSSRCSSFHIAKFAAALNNDIYTANASLLQPAPLRGQSSPKIGIIPNIFKTVTSFA